LVMTNNKNYVQGSVVYKLKEDNKVEKKTQNKPRKNKQSKKLFKFVLKVLFVSFFSFIILARFYNIIKLNAEIRNLKKEIKLVQDENDNLRVEIAKFNTLKNIDKLAVQKYGMIVPHPSDVYYVDVTPLNVAKDEENNKKINLSFIYRLLGLIQ